MPRTATKEKKETKAKTSTKKSAEKEGKALVIV